MMRTPDAFTGFFDNQATGHREYWDNGVRGRHAHKRTISPNNPWPELREPWETYPDLPDNYRLTQYA